nr:hypothetical protein [Tanacetum cinerariifolium]
MDLFGPTFVKILNKKSYCLVIIDDYSRFTWVFFLAIKDETSPILKTFITGLENQLSLKVKVIRSDNGTEFKIFNLNHFYGMKGIKKEISVPRTPQQNGIAERKNRTLIEAARTMLADSLLPIPFWAEAVNTACYVQNRVLVTKPHNTTPYELLHGRTPSIGFMRSFGCPVTILNTLDSLEKFEGRVDEGFLVGYSVNSKAFRVFNSRTRIVQETLHVNFLENKPNITGSGPTWLFYIDSLTRTMNYQPVTAGNQTNSSAGCSDNSSNEVNAVGSIVPTVGQNSSNSTNPFSVVGPSNTIASLKHGKSSFIDASQLFDDPDMPELEDIIYSDDENDVGAEADFNNLEISITVSHIPTTRIHKDHLVSQIIGDLSSTTQTRSMTRIKEELLQFKMQKVWILVDLPYGKRAIGTKWVYKNKKDKKGIVVRNKARLTLQFEDPDHPNKVYKVVKALYGLHQAPRAWYETLANYLLENGFQRDKIDQTLFIKKQKGDILLVQIYVDDIIYGATNNDLCNSLEKLMKDKFHMSSMRELTFFLGLQVNDLFIDVLNFIKTRHHVCSLWYPKDSPFVLVAYSDSDYAGAILDRKSTTGGCQFLGCRLISWQCKKQTVVATSSTEAEYVAAARQEIKEGDADEHVEDVTAGDDAQGDDTAAHGEVPTVTQEPSIPSPTPTIPPSQPPQDIPLTSQEEDKKVKEAKVDESAQVQGREAESQAKIYKIDMDHASKVLSIQEDEPDEVQKVVDVVTTAKLITEVVTAVSEIVTAASAIISAAEPQVHTATITVVLTKVVAAPSRRRKGVIEIDEEYARKLHAELNKDIDWDVAIDHVKPKAKEDPAMQRYQGMSYDDIRPIFEAKFNSNIEFLLNTKEQMEEEGNQALQSINETPTQKAAKRRKLNKEVGDLKRHLEIMSDEDDDLYTEATLLARKVPIVDYEIIELNNKPYYKIIRANGTHQLYISFLTLLKNFDREDLEALRSLVKERVDTSDDTVMDDESNQGRMIVEMDKDDVVVLMDDKKEDKKDEEAKVVESAQEDETKPAKVQEEVDVVTTAKLITEVVTAASETVTAVSAIIPTVEPQVPADTITAAPAKVVAAPSRKRKGVAIRDPKEELTTSSIIPAETKSKDKGKGILVEEPKPLKKKQQIKMDEEYARKLHAELNKDIDLDVAIDHVKLKAKEDPVGMSYDDIRLIFEAKFNSNVDFLLKTKEQMEEEEIRALQTINETLAEKAGKRIKLNEEVEDLKRHLEIMPDEDDDVYIEATPLARKVPVVDYKIIEINNKPYYKIIRADGTHQLYTSFLTLLKNFDREDLEALWNLVKERFSTSKPKNLSDDFLLTTLGEMFEKPDALAQVWKNQRTVHGQENIKSWKLLESCGVHIITFTTTHLILLVERRYPLSRFTLDQMLNAVRLQVEEKSEVSLELLRFTRQQHQEGQHE